MSNPDLDANIAAFINRARLRDGMHPTQAEIARAFGLTAYQVMLSLRRIERLFKIKLLPFERSSKLVSVPDSMTRKLVNVLGQIDAMRKHAPVRCGNCKGTGWQHEWSEEALLEPVKLARPCIACNGKGVVK